MLSMLGGRYEVSRELSATARETFLQARDSRSGQTVTLQVLHEEAADRMRLPLGCSHHGCDRHARWRTQHCNDAGVLRVRPVLCM